MKTIKTVTIDNISLESIAGGLLTADFFGHIIHEAYSEEKSLEQARQALRPYAKIIVLLGIRREVALRLNDLKRYDKARRKEEERIALRTG